MNNQKSKQILLDIVKTWHLKEIPEYRGFRCANCQEYKNEAWYHWLNSNGYQLPVHMCDEKCESQFQKDTIVINPTKKTSVNRNVFGSKYLFKDKTIKRFKEIVAFWPEYREPEFKAFFCDECGKDLYIDETDGQRKGFHVWWKTENSVLTELHFHKECGNKLGILYS